MATRILVVDDSAIMRALIELNLRDAMRLHDELAAGAPRERIFEAS
jgi:CheY-like chemotaxis protein